MWMLTVVVAGMLGAADGDLAALEQELAGLAAQRQFLRTSADSTQREALDRKVAVLEQARTLAQNAAVAKMDACAARVLGNGVGVGVSPAEARLMAAVACAASTEGVVSAARRVETLQEQLRSRKWTYGDRQERDAVQAELAHLQAWLAR